MSCPVSRVLFQRLRAFGDHLSCVLVADDVMRSTRDCGRATHRAAAAPLRELRPLDLAPGGVCRATAVTCDAGGLLHHRFTLTVIAHGGLFSVALSLGSPRVAVNHHLALRSPDFPRRTPLCVRRDHPGNSSMCKGSGHITDAWSAAGQGWECRTSSPGRSCTRNP